MFRKEYPYVAMLSCTGRHPYLQTHELDYFEGCKLVSVRVAARDFNHASRRAANLGPGIRCWGWHVAAVAHAPTPKEP